MALSKKDYIAIAKIISDCENIRKGSNTYLNSLPLVYDLTEYFQADNPRFNGAKFIGACKGRDINKVI